MVRRIEIMGEAVKNLPATLRTSNPHVPWARIAGMRDKVIHDYFGVDVALVWTVATTLLGQLRTDVQTILDQLQSSSGGAA